ncbi:hypothetical protein ACI7YT_12625 [Microbacterium sp. M]|uniref:hypothetical protein n=1 Tax=Microbacterium sp. M TaxID=3377125 RepID=UPI003867D911
MITQTLSERLAVKRQPGARPTVDRRDISLTESVELFPTLGLEVSDNTQWEAVLDGRLSTGESVQLERSGSTSAEALAALEAAIEENGWEIR